jgi:integrative and conjugative element protein (TIGR02256 family)
VVFSSIDQQFSFELSDSQISYLLDFIKRSRAKETGGILIGKYNRDHSVAIVKKLTGPPKDSSSGFVWFQRGLHGLQQLLERHWVKQEYYLGEWHYHPYSSPNPSHQDIQQMKTIALSKPYHCPEPIMMIIGGDIESYDIRVFIALRGKEFIELHEEGLSTH